MTIQNLIINNYNIDEGESTCIMSTHIWKMLSSPNFTPSLMTLQTYDGCPSQLQ
jgi:hypothetical protein